MPPKKKVVGPPPPPPVPRDLARRAPIDGRDGTLGVEHLETDVRARELQREMALFRIEEAFKSGALELDLQDSGLDEIPEPALALPWLQVVDLQRNLFVNSVLEQLKRLPNLRAVNLTSNLLHGTLPDALGALPSAGELEELCLDENIIERLPESAAAFTAMTWFSIRKNLLVDLSGVLLSSWAKLEHLDLRDNKLKSVPDSIGACSALTTLLLSGNELTDLPDAIGKCTALQTLLVQRNMLTTLPAGLAGCSALVTLDATKNILASLPFGLFTGMPALQQLFLGQNKITDLPVDIGALKNLEVLSVASNALKALPEELSACTRLRELYVSNNAISALPAGSVAWTAIETINARFCKLKTLPADVETAWMQLKVVDARVKKGAGCKVTEVLRDVPGLHKVRWLGITWTKPKKAKAGKK